MKKTLAAVLAAAMALSTATVAFAADTQDITFDNASTSGWEDSNTNGDTTYKKDLKIGDTTKYNLGGITITPRGSSAGTGIISDTELYTLIDDNLLKPTVVVSAGKNNLESTPVVKAINNQAQLHFKLRHTFGTGDISATMRVKLTAAKDIYYNGTTFTSQKPSVTAPDRVENYLVLKKGDTLVSEDVTYKRKYDEITYGSDITITVQEVKDNYVRVVGEELFSNAGSNDKVTIYFDNYGAFEAKISPAQKDLNLYYSIGEISEIPELAQLAEEYSDIDFEFITFRGAPSVTSFINSGTMTFNAIGGANTQVYFLKSAGGGDDAVFEPLDGKYDKTYDTIEVKGIKKLSGTFVIASEMLEVVNDDEDYEPVSSAPVVEEPSSSQPADNGGDRNPSTGAC